jgi:phage terminase large subunit-like protein
MALARTKDEKVQEVYKLAISYTENGWEPSWEERFSILDVCYMVAKMGHRLAQREYFNNPTSEGKVFKKKYLVDGKIPPLNKMPFKVAYLDPGFKKTSTSDTKSWVLIGLHEGRFYIIKAFCDVASVSEMVEWGYEIDTYLKRKNAVARFSMEQVFLQDLLYKDFDAVSKTKGYALPLSGDTRKKPDKDSRIEAIAGHFERGNVIFNEEEKDNPHMIELKEQFLNFETGVKTKKDGPDAVEGGMHILQQSIVLNADVHVGQRHANNYKI